MPKLVDLSGQRFGTLTVTARAGRDKHKKVLYSCVCDCGAKTVVNQGFLRRTDSTKSCDDCKKQRTDVFGDCVVIWLRRENGCHLPCVVDKTDYDKVRKYCWHAAFKTRTYYAETNTPHHKGRTHLKMHSLLTGYKRTDHIDGDGLNNRRNNLRSATHAQNRTNERKRRGNYSSQFKGVFYDKRRGKFAASIKAKQQGKFLGYFDNETDAARAYNKAALKHFGEFASLNDVGGVELIFNMEKS
jgi:hypothetical protein